MDKTKHTPRPWRVHAEDDGRLSIESDFGTVAEVLTENCDLPEQCKADADLIAAAPEMLEMLAAMDDVILAAIPMRPKHIDLAEWKEWNKLFVRMDALVKKFNQQ